MLKIVISLKSSSVLQLLKVFYGAVLMVILGGAVEAQQRRVRRTMGSAVM